jgi:integrase
MTFSVYVNRWYAVQDLAASTMQNYRRHIEDHLLPAFGEMPIADITATDIAAWEKQERAVGYAESSIRSWRSRLHLILADAVEEGIRESNPAARRRGRGRRTGRSVGRAPEKAITDALGVLLIAERVALLSGRDDDFVAVVLKGYTGMRWGEVVGLEVPYLRPAAVRVEWQLYELDTGELLRCPPKDGSRRTVDIPDWLERLLADHVARATPRPCACHGLRYVFSGHRPPNGATRRPGANLVDVAQRAGVSPATVSASFNHAEVVHEATRARIAAAVAELGYVRGGSAGELAAHPRRSNFATWLFQPAATGQYPKKGRLVVRPVPVVGEPRPGVPVRGRNAAARADACWLPIAPGLTPHGLRHTHKTVMEELGTPSKLMDERMGHDDGSVQAVYSHITAQMRRRLLDGLTALWRESLEARRAMTPGSPVAVLDRLLRERSGE